MISKVYVAVKQLEDGCCDQSQAAASECIRQRISSSPWLPGQEATERENRSDLWSFFQGIIIQ